METTMEATEKSQYNITKEYATVPPKISVGMLPSDVVSDESSRFIFIPLVVLFCVFMLSALVFLISRRSRRLAHFYCKSKINRSFGNYNDDSDSALEQQPNDVDDDFDDPTECLLKGKLQIDNVSHLSNNASYKLQRWGVANLGHDEENWQTVLISFQCVFALSPLLTKLISVAST